MPPTTPDRPLAGILAKTLTPALVLSDTEPPSELPDDVSAIRLGDPPSRDAGWGSVVLAVADRGSLRRAASVLPVMGRSRVIHCLVRDTAEPLSLVLRPEWPDLIDLKVRTLPSGGAVTTLRFAKRAPVAEVLVELARHAGTPTTAGHHGVVAARVGLQPDTLPPVDTSTVVLDRVEDAADPERQVPPDVVFAPQAQQLAEHPVTGRPPLVLTDSDELAIGPLDEALLNPVGFRSAWDRGVVPLDAADGPTEALVEMLRPAQGVRVSWPGDGVVEHARTVAGLAMAGIPLVTDPVPEPSRALLGDRLADLLVQEVDLDDPLRREEHSIEVRRAGIDRHSSVAWRGRLAERAGLRHASYPSVSVLLVVHRPEQLSFALAQAARQRVDVEVVLAAVDLQPDAGLVREHLGARPHTVLALPGGTPTGEGLVAAAEAAGGDVVVTLAGRDRSGPDLVGDLLLARRYSGADVVGMPPEIVFLERAGVTVRRRVATECFAHDVGGGPLLVDRSLLRATGGEEVPGSVRALGGCVYRTHGLDRVVCDDAPQGAGAGPAEDDDVLERWKGFRPSRLVQHDPDSA